MEKEERPRGEGTKWASLWKGRRDQRIDRKEAGASTKGPRNRYEPSIEEIGVRKKSATHSCDSTAARLHGGE